MLRGPLAGNRGAKSQKQGQIHWRAGDVVLRHGALGMARNDGGCSQGLGFGPAVFGHVARNAGEGVSVKESGVNPPLQLDYCHRCCRRGYVESARLARRPEGKNGKGDRVSTIWNHNAQKQGRVGPTPSRRSQGSRLGGQPAVNGSISVICPESSKGMR